MSIFLIHTYLLNGGSMPKLTSRIHKLWVLKLTWEMWIILWNPCSSFKAFLGSLSLLIKSIKTEYQRVLYQIGHTSELINKLRTKKKILRTKLILLPQKFIVIGTSLNFNLKQKASPIKWELSNKPLDVALMILTFISKHSQ